MSMWQFTNMKRNPGKFLTQETWSPSSTPLAEGPSQDGAGSFSFLSSIIPRPCFLRSSCSHVSSLGPSVLTGQGAWGRAALMPGGCLHGYQCSLEHRGPQPSAASRTQFTLKWQGNFQFSKTHFLSTLTAKYFMPSGPVAPWGPACPGLSACHYDEKIAPWWVGGEGPSRERGRGRSWRKGECFLLSPLQPCVQRTWEGSCAGGASPGYPSARVMSWTRPSAHASLTSPPY